MFVETSPEPKLHEKVRYGREENISSRPFSFISPLRIRGPVV